MMIQAHNWLSKQKKAFCGSKAAAYNLIGELKQTNVEWKASERTNKLMKAECKLERMRVISRVTGQRLMSNVSKWNEVCCEAMGSYESKFVVKWNCFSEKTREYEEVIMIRRFCVRIPVWLILRKVLYFTFWNVSQQLCTSFQQETLRNVKQQTFSLWSILLGFEHKTCESQKTEPIANTKLEKNQKSFLTFRFQETFTNDVT